MGRLIDADALKSLIAGMAISNNYHANKANALCELIDAQPTAYDVDKVVRQLEAYSNADEAERLGTMPVVELVDTIKIVKGGGADAKTDS